MLPEQPSSAEGKGREATTAPSCDFDPKLGSEVFNYGGEGRSRSKTETIRVGMRKDRCRLSFRSLSRSPILFYLYRYSQLHLPARSNIACSFFFAF
jgi:hypothetical protein